MEIISAKLIAEISIQIENQKNILLKDGELFVVPKGTQHKPSAKEDAYVLLFERQDITTKGD